MDKWMLATLLCLHVIGTIAIYEATANTALHGLHVNNIVLVALSCIPMLCIGLVDYRILISKLSYVLYGVGIGLLVVVMFTGENINGAIRWLSIGGFQLQPSEMMKLATVMLAAYLLSKRAGESLRPLQDLLPICIVFLIPLLLILKQPDLGTALVFVGVLLSMLWIGNIRAMYMLLCMGVITISIGLICWLYYTDQELLAKIVQPHQLSRIQTFLDPTSDADKAWHVNNAMNAIGSGGLSGNMGFYLRRGFIPYAYSDSIFVVIGEHYGFLGSSILLLCYFMLIYRMVLIVKQCRDIGGAYLVLGILGILVFQIIVNIGMHIGLMPLTGISLPFISYGGSALLTNMVAMGFVLSVHLHKDEFLLDIPVRVEAAVTNTTK
ncbi:FtsW/RodA/SpoVE family cell cycle protein [Paenibacillus sp. UMB4589-SE434]|uniref:FtsW/RodA/SpoVE family cell cycle protein n=1 Tax=Paenibacillus sp. UMB4589-SE434 TaxID=3046314 RepID=UPI00254A4F05|nr:FtsW/RodA/SpoVE family cell cycle protein [Paenibacillus sp. UMB4589-SE434]MDK8179835.1 FtsW/RodA/SpoVE family cell cycle protein [Paenibacillus sp. UMB4589-SE434]